MAIIAGYWARSAWLAAGFFLLLPFLLLVGWISFVEGLFLRKPRRRVVSQIDAYITRQRRWEECDDYVTLEAAGLPHGNRVEVWLDLATGRFSSTQRTYLRHFMSHSKQHKLQDAVSVINGQIGHSLAAELTELMGGIPATGNVKLPSTVRDGFPFTLEIIRRNDKRVFRTNLAGLPQDTDVDEVRVAIMLFRISGFDGHGTASCGPDGEITLYGTSDDASLST